MKERFIFRLFTFRIIPKRVWDYDPRAFGALETT